ncbi:MAG: hypothetical protein MUF72_14315 [Elainella sp. Prado103]|nr:hypothetical protein [Elainella sp. Prado103]
MSSHRSFEKPLPLVGMHPAAPSGIGLPEILFSEDLPASELYPEAVPPALSKKHSSDFTQNRLKLRQIAQAKLTQLSEELCRLTNTVRYYDPVMAEVLDEACEATAEALSLMEDPD